MLKRIFMMICIVMVAFSLFEIRNRNVTADDFAISVTMESYVLYRQDPRFIATLENVSNRRIRITAHFGLFSVYMPTAQGIIHSRPSPSRSYTLRSGGSLTLTPEPWQFGFEAGDHVAYIGAVFRVGRSIRIRIEPVQVTFTVLVWQG